MSIKKLAIGAMVGALVGLETLRRTATSYESEVERRQWFQGWAKDMVIPMFDRAGTNVEGLENIPDDGPYIFAPKHIYGTDPFTAAHAGLSKDRDLELIALAKHQIESWPIISDLLYGTAVFVNRVPHSTQSQEARDAEIFDKMDKLATETVEVDMGRGATIIHPEGTREPMGVLPVKKGALIAAAMMAQKLGRPVPIVPVGIANNSPLRYLQGILTGKGKHKIEITIGNTVWVDESILALFRSIKGPETGEIWRDKHPEVQLLMESLRVEILVATNASRQRCGMEPLDYIDTPSKEHRARRIGAKAVQG